jgi:hypothetical protein
LIPWFSKTEGNTYATLLHHPFLFGEIQHSAQEVARRISGAVVGESAEKSTYQVPITYPYLPHYIICHLPLVFLSPTSPLPFYSHSLSLSILPLFSGLPLFHLLVVMASPLSSPLSPENEVLNFKQREGEISKRRLV